MQNDTFYTIKLGELILKNGIKPAIAVVYLEDKNSNDKKDIHPDYKKTVIKCVCGNEIETASVGENITVEICSNCHPFFTGQQKILDSEGRVERFNKRYGKK